MISSLIPNRFVRTLSRIGALALGAFTLFARAASAQDPGELVHLINAYRAVPQSCEGVRTAAAGPLAPNSLLAGVQLSARSQLLDELKARAYLAASADAISVSGPTRPSEVMKFVEQRYCRVLTAQKYTDIGVRRDGDLWQIVIARRLLSPTLGDLRTTGREILRLTNAARAEPRACGSRRFGAAPPLTWNDELADAALAHSRDMANRNFFDHAGSDGSQPDVRVARAGYVWQRVGENIAAGQGSSDQVVAAWLTSPVHCASIMEAAFIEMGAAYVINANSDPAIFWTQDFGTPR